MNFLFDRLKQILLLVIVGFLCVSCSNVPSISENPWKYINLDTDAILADLAFTSDSNHGWLVGTKATLFETNDGGDTWQPKTIDLGEEKVSFTGISFNDNEGWITGQPNVLLHTANGGETWERIPLSDKLPGIPYDIIALAPDTAEMVTNLGAIYKTTDGGKSWKGLVEGAVGVARSINRSADGKYVAVSARGNFYSTWQPGDTEWTPHNRTSSKRLQNMGFFDDDRLWLIARGGQIQLSQSQDLENWDEPINPEYSASWGFLDLATRQGDEVWVAGGSGNLLVSRDGGLTWEKDREIESVPSNLYKIVFLDPDRGFVLGERGVLLKYNTQNAV
ncbi:photosynthesis system II assembly factor Ycf48 [Geminocystis sp. NIES-3709]|uniref:photosynthesis system II assembly factor Ycf48 n=1 Tax=Geminocystis sp. NIES-3709 TaxID=1617448 RepID=UPI0005FC4023|nr:photosynthesis system II assembly factor Ycf48 [Geminocystis sp. NIES-3709]BAQ65802.1 photosystem II stability/assembly factor HCF136/Ycf48 [Geminocystis sp. NIES-3709]